MAATTPASLALSDPREVWRPSTAGYIARGAAFLAIAVVLLGLPLWLEMRTQTSFFS